MVINNPKNNQIYGGKVAAPVFKELSDKVFAMDMHLHSPIAGSDFIKNLPDIKKGDIDDITLVLQNLKF